MFLDPAAPESWPVPRISYEADALAFCRSWLRGQATFTLHTSGSTGTPKPIELRRAQMQASAQLTGQTLGLQSGDAALVCLNVRYVAGVMMLVRGLELGLPMTIVEPTSDPLATCDPISHPFAFAAFVPLQLQTMLDPGEQRPQRISALNAMKAILVGGAATSPALDQAIQDIDAPVYATYGMTETVSHIALRRLNGPDRSEVFTALAGVELGTDERGCLHITAAVTNFVRVQTNDMVQLLTPMRFRLLGRADTVINSGGVKVQPEPIERLIYQTMASTEPPPRFFVAGLPDERLGQRLVVISQQPIAPDVWLVVQRAIREQMGPYAVPKETIVVPDFAETPTGKLDRNATIARIR